MSIRLIAKDLYRLHKEVERLERQLSSCSPERKVELQKRLAEARAERDKLQRILEESKGNPPYRKPR